MEKIGRPGGRNLIGRFFKYLRNEEGETRKWYQKPDSILLRSIYMVSAFGYPTYVYMHFEERYKPMPNPRLKEIQAERLDEANQNRATWGESML